MPMKNGGLFLPIKKAIRKKIKKEEGDSVHIKLFLENRELKIPIEIKECIDVLEEEVQEKFRQHPKTTLKKHIDFILQAKTDTTKEKRILQLIEELSK